MSLNSIAYMNTNIITQKLRLAIRHLHFNRTIHASKDRLSISCLVIVLYYIVNSLPPSIHFFGTKNTRTYI